MDVSAEESKELPTKSGISRRRLAMLLVLAGLLLFVFWLGLKGWRVAQAARSLQQRQAEAETLLEGGMMAVDPDAAEALILGVREDVVVLRQETAPFLWLAPAFTWLPRVGPLLAEAKPLLEMADAGTAAAVYGIDSLKPALVLLQEQGDDGQQLLSTLLPVLEEAGPDLRATVRELQRVEAARAEIENPEVLPWTVQQLLAQLDSKLYLIDELQFLQVLPSFLGSNSPRNYLIMAQNEDELRPTGGYLTGAGLLTVDQGRIVNLQFQDANTVDAWGPGWTLTKPYGPAPAPLQRLMGTYLFLYRDANFWPDFPISAEQAMALYTYGKEGPPLDGAIAIDQQFLEMLLRVTGPVYVSTLEQNIGANNVVAGLRTAWQPEAGEATGDWVFERKDFLGPFATALQDHLFNSLGSMDPLYLAETMHTAFAQKHIQVYVRDPEIAGLLDRLNWDGRIEAPAGSDLLMPVDANVGFNKVSSLIASTLTYEVTLDETGSGSAEAILTYEHTDPEPYACVQGITYDSDPSYSEMMRGCFWNYQRLYVPAGSQLLEASSNPVDEDLFDFSDGWNGEAVVVTDEPLDLSVFANFFVLAPGEQLESRYRYQLPDVVVAEDGTEVYRLELVRQAGLAPRPVTVTVHLPDGAELVTVSPTPLQQDGATIVFETTPATDTIITVVYRQ